MQLIRKLPNLNEKNKERPLCFGYSIKARAILHAHLSRIALNPTTLELDRRVIVGKCPYLIQEQVNCVNQLILLAYSRRSKYQILTQITLYLLTSRNHRKLKLHRSMFICTNEYQRFWYIRNNFRL